MMNTGNLRPGASNLQLPTNPTASAPPAVSPVASKPVPVAPVLPYQRDTSAVPGEATPPRDYVAEFWANLSEPGRVAMEALKKAGTAITGISFEEFTTLTPEHSPGKYPNHSEQDEAANLLNAYRSSETQALGRLSPEQRTAYDNVRAQLAGNTTAQRALQKLLLDNRLTGEPLAHGGDTLLDHLQTMTQQPLAAGIDRQSWLADTLVELYKPERICQHAWNTCGATSAQILVARENPAEYARLQSGLASPEGKVDMIGGDTLKREADWNSEVSPNSGAEDLRTTSGKLFQSAVMELGNGFGFVNYDATADVHKPEINIFGWKISTKIGLPGLPGGIPGLPDVGMENILKQLTGKDYQNHMPMPWQREGTWNEVEQALADGRGPVSTVLMWQGSMPHYVQIDRVDNDKVHFTNPHGVQQTLSKREFYDHLLQVQIRQS